MKRKAVRFDPAQCPRCSRPMRIVGGLRRCGCGHVAGEQNPMSEQPRNDAGRVEPRLQEERYQ